MTILQSTLDRTIARRGEDDPVVQIMKRQIAAAKRGQGFQELYVTGSVARLPQKQMKE